MCLITLRRRLLNTLQLQLISRALLYCLSKKEVAVRLAAKAGDMSILAVSAQIYANVRLGDVVPAALFTPPPKSG